MVNAAFGGNHPWKATGSSPVLTTTLSNGVTTG